MNIYQTDHTIVTVIYVFSSPAAMAKTPKCKAKAKVATPKPKPRETKETKESKKRKAADANPFESPPDTNQASIRAFAKPIVPDASSSTQSGTQDTITHDHDVVMDTSGAAPEKNVDEEKVSSTVAVDTVDTSQLGGVAHDDSGNTKMSHPWSLPEFVAISQDNIDLEELVQAVRQVAIGQTFKQWTNICYTAVSEIGNEDKISSLIGQCRDHPNFQEHVRAVRKEVFDNDDIPWTFGDEEGDPASDLSEMIIWLVKNKPPQQSNSMTGTVPVQPQDGDQSAVRVVPPEHSDVVL